MFQPIYPLGQTKKFVDANSVWTERLPDILRERKRELQKPDIE
jgi:hypothetical protein